MNIHKIYAVIFKVWRQKRIALFESTIKPGGDEILLDVGGYPNTWTTRPQLTKRIDWKIQLNVRNLITTVVGDGCALDYDGGAYDIVFSNSVIEHVGDWRKQQAFANEVRRVGKKLWVQTPAYECPFEPHFLAPFVH